MISKNIKGRPIPSLHSFSCKGQSLLADMLITSVINDISVQTLFPFPVVNVEIIQMAHTHSSVKYRSSVLQIKKFQTQMGRMDNVQRAHVSICISGKLYTFATVSTTISFPWGSLSCPCVLNPTEGTMVYPCPKSEICLIYRNCTCLRAPEPNLDNYVLMTFCSVQYNMFPLRASD